MFNRRAFTLLEVVLAIGLCAAVMALLTTAIDLYLVRVDTSRTQVETAQLARTLLNQIADDLRAVRFSSSALGGSTSLGAAAQPAGGSAPTSGSTTLAMGSATELGIYGTQTELRIDRAAERGWRHVAVPSAQMLTNADPTDMPQTIEYSFLEGRVMPSAQFAAGGVSVETPLVGYTGLYRRQTPTAAMANSVVGTSSSGPGEPAVLVAPEVVQISFMYFDGAQWYEQWDSSAQQMLPVAVEIKISLFADVLTDKAGERDIDEEARRRDSTRWVEHRLLVRIPRLDEPQQYGGSSPGNQQQGPQGQGGPPDAT